MDRLMATGFITDVLPAKDDATHRLPCEFSSPTYDAMAAAVEENGLISSLSDYLAVSLSVKSVSY